MNYVTLNEIQLLRDAQSYDLSGPWGEDEAENPYDRAERELEEVLALIRGLRGHVHQWGNDDYCSICGADGRA